MIIFDLDGTLADCEHRRHFVDPIKNNEFRFRKSNIFSKEIPVDDGYYDESGSRFCADWKSFYEACDKDLPINPVLDQLSYYLSLIHMGRNVKKESTFEVQIWSGRCESVIGKTISWLVAQGISMMDLKLKMRPIGDNTPDDKLKERWLDEELSKGNKIDFVFDSDPKSIAMWRGREIFVFDCNQGEL